MSHLVAATNKGSVHFLCMDYRHMKEMLNAGEQKYTNLLNLCVWVKDNGGMGSFYRSRHELVFVYHNGEAPHRNNIQLGRYGRNRTNIWEYPGVSTMSKQGEEGNLLALHPTVKPVAMVADALLDCSAPKDIVLDPFLGSGTTLIAAESRIEPATVSNSAQSTSMSPFDVGRRLPAGRLSILTRGNRSLRAHSRRR